MAYRTSIPVRFGDVDHAGIVYYPHFYIYFHEAFEDFFNENGVSYVRMLDERRLGFPSVHVTTDFKQPLRYGDRLDIEMMVSRLGRRSATFRYVGYRHRDGALCVNAEVTIACINLDTFQSCDLSGEVRDLFSRFTA